MTKQRKPKANKSAARTKQKKVTLIDKETLVRQWTGNPFKKSVGKRITNAFYARRSFETEVSLIRQGLTELGIAFDLSLLNEYAEGAWIHAQKLNPTIPVHSGIKYDFS